MDPIQETGHRDDGTGPRSPSPSDVSYESQMSSGNSGTEYGIRSVHTTTDSYTAQNISRTTLKAKTITATVDVLKGGFLRGDQIPIRVTVNHTKHIRSLKGIIITLYRQARVDMHPALPVAPNSKGDKTKSEEYYPKSRTGLGGLSLSSAGSSHLFRKDLCQSFAPLFVDPRTLTAEVKCAVRVPDEAFPTISNVPGAMISFKYYVEVIIDIQGKLTGLDRMVANTGLVNLPASSAGGAKDDTSSSMFSTWGGNFVDTDQIRREKGVICTLFEVIIGTKDSERSGKKKQVERLQPSNDDPAQDIPYDSNYGPNGSEGYGGDHYNYDANGQYYDYGYDASYYDTPGYDQSRAEHGPYAPPIGSSGPLHEEPGLSEKERLRRAEERLLPSQPPEVGGPSFLSNIPHTGVPASAPVLPEEDEFQLPRFEAGSSSSGPSHPPPPFRAASNPSVPHVNPLPLLQRRATGIPDASRQSGTITSSSTVEQDPSASLSAPTRNGNNSDHTKPLPPIPLQPDSGLSGSVPGYFASASSQMRTTDDKQELQRRRLEMERSAPPLDHDEDANPSRPPTSSSPSMNGLQSLTLAPSAPVLDEDDEGLVDAMRIGRGNTGPASATDRRVSEALPQYER